MTKEGWYVNRQGPFNRTFMAKGYVGAEQMIAAVGQLDLGAKEGAILAELVGLNVVIRSILSKGGAVSGIGTLVAINWDDVPLDQEFKDNLNEKGIVRCTIPEASNVLGRKLKDEEGIFPHQNVYFYAPRLDSRLSYWKSKWGGIGFMLDGKKHLYNELEPLERHVSRALHQVGKAPNISVSAETFTTQILCDASRIIGQGQI